MGIDLFVVCIYLALALLVGIWKGRGIKTISDYAVANKSYPTIILVMTIAATWYGGEDAIGIPEKVYSLGIIFMFFQCTNLVAKFIIAYFIAPKATEFKSCISVGDVIGTLYGKFPRVVTALCGTLIAMGKIGVQIGALGYVFHHFTGIDREIGILIGAVTIVIYSTFGGIRAVTATDVLQFCMLIVIIPLVANVAVSAVGGYHNLYSQIPSDKLTLFPESIHPNKVWELFPIYLIPFLDPAMMQRLLMSRNPNVLSNSFKIVAFIDLAFYFVIGIIGFCAFLLFKNIDPSLAMTSVINELLPVGVKGFAIAGLLAVIMSTADSQLNASGVLFVHDFLNPLLPNWVKKRELLFTKIFTVIIGVVSIYFALKFENLIDLMLASLEFWGPVIVVPLLAGVLGCRVKKGSNIFIYSGLGGFFCYMGWRLFNLESALHFSPLIPSMLANLIVYLIVYRFDSVKSTREKYKKYRQSVYEKICNVTLFPNGILNSIKESTKRLGAPYIAFGSFALVNYMLPYFMWYDPAYGHSDVALVLRLIAAIACFVLLIKDLMPEMVRKFVPLYWYLLLVYCLPFMTTLLFFMSSGSVTWVINMALAVLLLIILVDWISFIVLWTLGGIAAFSAYYLIFGNSPHLHMSFDNYYLAVYLNIFAALIGTIFSRNKEMISVQVNRLLNKKIDEKTADLAIALQVKDRFLKNMSHELRSPLHALTNISSGLKHNWRDMSQKDKERFLYELSSSADRLRKLMSNVLNFVDLEKNHIKFQKQEFDICKLLKLLAKKHENIALKCHLKLLKIKGDEEYILGALEEIIHNANKFSNSDQINIDVYKSRILIKDRGPGIIDGEEDKIFEPFVEGSNTASKAGGRGLGLALAKAILIKHNIKIKARNYTSGAEFEIIF
ncbi:MAG: ATP-binding protein [Rickettsiales bacterium]